MTDTRCIIATVNADIEVCTYLALSSSYPVSQVLTFCFLNTSKDTSARLIMNLRIDYMEKNGFETIIFFYRLCIQVFISPRHSKKTQSKSVTIKSPVKSVYF